MSAQSAVQVSLLGLPTPGETLTAVANGSDPNFVYSYQWQSSADGSFDDAVDIGTGGATYQVQPSDLGATLRVLVTAVDLSSSLTAAGSAETPAIAPFTWVGGDGDWSLAANWNFAAVPGVDDFVDIATPVTVIATLQAAAELELAQGATLSIADSFNLAGGTGGSGNDGEILVNPGATLTLGGPLTQGSDGSLIVNGGTVDGALDLTTGYARFYNGATVSSNGAPILLNYASAEFDGYSDFSNSVTLQGANLFFGGSNLSSPLNTDSGDLGDGVSDPNWTVSTTSGPAVVLDGSIVADAYWSADNATSGWIGAIDSGTNLPPAPYSFTTTFTDADPSQPLAGLFYVDDAGSVTLNGTPVVSASLAYSSSCNGAIFLLDAAHGLTQGLNTLTIEMTGADGTYDGARMQMIAPVTIDAGTVIQGDGGVYDNYNGVNGPALIINQGVIDANVSGQGLTVAPTGFFNEGLIEAVDDGVLYLGGSQWTNEVGGTITVDDSTVYLDGTFANFGQISTQNSNIFLNGYDTLQDLGDESYSAATGNTYTNFVNTNPTSIVLFAGFNLGAADVIDMTQGFFDNLLMNGYSSINGGTVILSAAAGGPTGSLQLQAGAHPYLQSVTADNAGTWTIGADDSLEIDGTLDNTGEVVLQPGGAGSATLIVGGNSLQLTGDGVITLEPMPILADVVRAFAVAPSSNLAEIVSDGTGNNTPTLTNVDDTIQGTGEIGDPYLSIQNNNGATIDANVSGQTLVVAPDGLLSNDGLIEATKGGVLEIGGGSVNSWTNQGDGTISVDDATAMLNGQFVNNNQITADDDATLTVGDGANAWLNDDLIKVSNSTASLVGPFVNDDTIVADDSASLTLGDATNSWTNNGSINVDDSSLYLAWPFVDNGYISGANSSIHFLGAVTVDAIVNAVQDNGGDSYFLDGELDLGGATLDTTSGGVFDGLTLDGGTISNGTLIVTPGSLNFEPLAGTISNATIDGDLTVASGVMDLDDVLLDGDLTVSGASAGASLHGAFVNSYTITADDSATLGLGDGVNVWTNNGAIYVDDATLNLAAPFVNNGTFTVGGSQINITGSVDLAALQSIVTGPVLDTVTLQGALDLGGATLTSAPTLLSGMTIDGGTLTDGSIDANSLNLTGNTANTISDTTFTTPFDVGAGEYVNLVNDKFEGGLTVENGGVAVLDDDIVDGGLSVDNGSVVHLDSRSQILDATGKNPGDVTLSSGTIDGGTIDASDANGAYLTVNGDDSINDAVVDNSGALSIGAFDELNLSGTLDNSGTLTLAGSFDYGYLGVASLGVGADGLTLTGGGTVTLNSDNGWAQIVAIAPTATLTNVDDTIQGAGDLGGPGVSLYFSSAGGGDLNLVNESGGGILANVASRSLFVAQNGSFDNSGHATASNGGTLYVGNPATITNEASGVIDANGGTVELHGAISNAGAISAENGGALTLNYTGASSNTGTISVDNASLTLAGAYDLAALGDYSYSAATGDVFTNFTVAAPVTLMVQGTIALNPAVSLTSVGVGDTLDATQGFFQNLALDDLTIVGGTVIASAAAGAATGTLGFTSSGGALLDTLVVNAGVLNLNQGQTVTLSGTFDNTGVFDISPTYYNSTSVVVGSDGLTLTGGGVVNLSNGGGAAFASSFTTTTLTNQDNTIQGGGHFGDAYLTVDNEVGGVIDADVSGQTLSIASENLFDNRGLAEASNGGVLEIGAYGLNRWTNEATGTISASGSELILNGPFTNDGVISVTNGTLDVVDAFTNNNTITLTGGALDLGGTVALASVDTISATGASVTLNGTLDLGGGVLDTTQGLFENLDVSGGAISSGEIVDGVGGTLQFTYNGSNQVENATVIATGAGGMILNGAYVTLSNDKIEGGITAEGGSYVLLKNGATVTDATGTQPGAIAISNSSVELQGYANLGVNVSLAGGGVYLTGPASAASSLDTDVGDLAGGAADPNWTVGAAAAAVLSAGNYYTYAGLDSATSGWIGAVDSSTQPASPYTFTTTFNVANADDAIFTGVLSVFGQATLSLNGQTVLANSNYPYGTAFVLDGLDGLNTGLNTLTITQTSTNPSYAAVRVQMVASVDIDDGVTIAGDGVVSDNYNGHGQELIDNKGLIEANVSNAWLTVDPTAFINEATAEAVAGGGLQIGSNNGGNATDTQWINAFGGVISADGASLNLTDRWINYGSITATGGSVDLGGNNDYHDDGRWINEGSISVTGGSLTLGAAYYGTNLNTSWTNTGSIAAADAAVRIDGDENIAAFGNLTRNGGSIALGGALNMNGVALDATSGLFQNLTLDGGALSDTTVTQGAGGALSFTGNNANQLSDVTLLGGLTVDNGFARLNDGSKIEDATGANPGAIALVGSELVLQGGSHLVDNVTLTNSTLNFTSPDETLSPLNTDDDGLASGSADPNWTVNGAPAVVLSPGSRYSNWSDDNSTSGWIGVQDSASQPPSPYTFTTTFNASAGAVIAGLFYIDDTGNLSLNGKVVSAQSDNYGAGSLFVLDADDGLVAGSNTLSINMTSSDGSYDGARIQIVSTYKIDAGVTVQGSGQISDNWDSLGQEVVINQNGGVLSGGEYDANANSGIYIAGNPAITTDAANVILGGVNAVVDSIGSTLTTVASAGRLELDSGAAINDGNAIVDAGAIVLAGGTLGAAGLTVGGSVSGYGAIQSAVTDNGVIEASGALDITGAVTGAGALDIDDGASLELGQGATATTTFAGLGLLKLDKPAAFAAAGGAIAGLEIGDVIDFVNTTVTSYQLLGTSLTVYLASGSLTFNNVTGKNGASLTDLQFNVESDGANGTKLVLAANTASLAVAEIADGDTVQLADAHVAATQTDSVALSISNLPKSSPADGLDVAVGAATGAAYGEGSITSLAAGATSSTNVSVGVDDTTAGAKSGTVDLLLTSDGTVSGGETTLPTQQIAVSGDVYRYAAAQFTTPAVKVVHVGDSVTEAIGVSNTDPADGFSENLIADASGVTGALDGQSGFVELAAGASDPTALGVTFDTSTAGYKTGDLQVALTSDGTGVDNLGQSQLAGADVQVSLIVDNYAKAAFQSLGAGTLTSTGADDWTLNLGDIDQGATDPQALIQAINAATGVADVLSGDYTLAAASGFANSGFANFEGVTASESDSGGAIDLSTATAGTFSETLTLAATGSNASGYSGALATQTLTITGTVIAEPDLVVTAIAPPPTALAGQEVPVSWTVANDGGAEASGSWTDNVYLASDAAGDDPQLLGSFVFNGALAAGASVTRTETVTLPQGYTGDAYFVVRADANNSVDPTAGAQNHVAVAATPTSVTEPPLPELAVTSIAPPSNASSGETAEVSWTVTNNGDAGTSTSGWVDKVYLAQGNNLDSNTLFDLGADTLLATVANPTYLAPGQSYANSATFTLPVGVSGPYYIYVVTDANNQVTEAPRGINNINVSSAFDVALTPPPDLQVTSILAPANTFSGQTFTLRWTVQNTGGGSTYQAADGGVAAYQGWYDTVWLSYDGKRDSSAIDLGTLLHVGALAAGAGYGAALNVTLPVGVSGTATLFVVSDSGDNVYEGVLHANNTSSTETAVALTPPPLLETTVTAVPETALAGNAIQVSWQVSNQGATTTPNSSWSDAIYLSSSPTLDASATLLAVAPHYGALAVGQSYSNTATVDLPGGLSGDEYIIVQTNYGQSVFEADYSKDAASAPITVANQPADLVVTGVTAPSVMQAGHQALVSWQVTDEGAGPTGWASWQDAIVLSASGVYGAADNITLASVSAPNGPSDPLAPGASYTQQAIVNLPYGLSGDYTLFVVADPSKSVPQASYADAASAGQTVDVQQRLADLQVTAVTPPSAPVAGQPTTVQWTVANDGLADPTSNYWWDAVYVSSTPTLTGQSVLLGNLQHVAALDPGQSYTAEATFTLPATLAGGQYYFIVQTDSQNNVVETTHADSVTASSAVAVTAAPPPPPAPELSVSDLSATADVVSGQPLTVSYTVTDNGGPTDEGWVDRVYLSVNQALGSDSDIYLGYLNDNPLAAGGSETETATFTVPNGLSGAYNVFVVADSDDSLNQSSTADDTAYTPVQIALPGAADFAVASVTASEFANNEIGVSYTVANNSANAESGSWEDAVYLSKTGVWSADDILLGTLGHTGGVAAGGSYSENFDASIPGVVPGEYQVIVRTDIKSEAAGTNATGVSAPFAVTLPTLTEGVAATGQLSTYSVASPDIAYYAITVSAGETLDLALTASTAWPANSVNTTYSTQSSPLVNEIYVSYGAIPTTNAYDESTVSQDTGGTLAGNRNLVIQDTQAGTYYIAVVGDQTDSAGLETNLVYESGSLSGGTIGGIGSLGGGSGQYVPVTTRVVSNTENYSLTVAQVPFSVTGVSPIYGGSSGEVTLTIDGSRLAAGDKVELVGPKGQVIDSSTVQFVNSTQLWANFNLQGAASGVYTVDVDDDATTATLANSFQISNSPAGELALALTLPSSLRSGQVGAVTVQYANVGSTDIVAPIVILDTQQATFLNSYGQDTGSDDEVFYAANPSGPAGVLAPGVVGTQSFSYLPNANVPAHGEIDFEAFTLAPNAPINLQALDEALYAPSIDATDWSNIWSNYVSILGTSYGSIEAALGAEATELSQTGQPTPSIDSLFTALLAQAMGGVFGGAIASATDLSPNQGGLGLTLTRSYSASLLGRNADSVFGYGWTSSLDGSASVDSSGNVYIELAGAYHAFALGANGVYTADTGDTATLSVVGGLYVMKDSGATVTFNAQGRIASYANADDDVTSYTYNAADDLVQVSDSATGETITFTSNAEGHITSATDSNGATATYNYDSSGNLLTSVTSESGTTDYTYDSAPGTASNNALTSTSVDGVQQNAFSYNSQGLLQSEAGPGGLDAVTLTYPSAGEVVATNSAGAQTKLFFTAAGQLSEWTDALGDTTQIEYNTAGEVVDYVTPGGEVTRYDYNSSNQVTSVTDPTGGVTTYGYSAAGGPIASITTELGATTTYTHDAAGDITKIGYQDGTSQSATYNSAGLTTSVTSAAGQTTTFGYNSAGALTSESFGANGGDSFTYNSQGQLTSASANGAVTTYSYNSDDELIGVTDPNGQKISYTYNSAGEVASMTDPDGTVTQYAYNGAGQITEITNGSGALIDKFSYNAFGELIQTKAGNGDVTNYSYDIIGRTTGISNQNASGQSLGFDDYVYNADSEIVSDTSQNGVWTYSYNGAGELTGANFTSSNSAIANQSLSYAYDEAGNRISETVNGVTTPYTVNAMNEVTAAGGVTYSYNADGQMTSEASSAGTTTYTYNQQGEIASASGPKGDTTYSYDALGDLISQTQNGVTTDFVVNPLADLLGDEQLSGIAASYNPAGGAATDYVYGAALAASESSGATSYYQADIAGDVTGVVGASGALDDAYFYDPFGQTTQLTGAAGGLFEFAGAAGIVSSDDGLDIMGLRAYDPTLGRFTSADPLGQSGSLNLYLYTGNNPTDAIDPTGEDATNFSISGSAGLAGGVNISIDENGGVYFGGSLGVATPGFSGAVTHSSDGSPGGLGVSLAGNPTAGGVGIVGQHNESWDPVKGKWVYSHETGVSVGTPGQGLSLMAGYTTPTPVFTIPQPHNDGPPPIKPNNNANDLLDALMGPGELEWDGDPTIGGLSGGKTHLIKPHDPNSIVGPQAYGDNNVVTTQNPLAYTILFENASTATAPAQTITITQQLDANLNWYSFRLTGLGFDNLNYTVGDTAYYSGLIDLSATKGYDVDVTAGVNVLTGVVTWVLQTIDPATGQTPLDPTVGLLPVDDSLNDGDGYVSYTIQANAGVANNSIVNAQATVVFDNQPPITTATISDTLDTVTPTSAVSVLPATTASPTFEVSWSGDDAGGAGIASYNIYVSEDGGAASLWLADTTLDDALYTGADGHTYAFSSQAIDNAGAVESQHTTPDATIEVGTVAPSALALTPASDTGAPKHPGYTSDATPVVTGLADAGATVTVYDGLTLLGATSADPVTGVWTFQTPTLAAGAHSLTATAVNATGVASSASAPLDITVETAAPTVTITSAGGEASAAAQTIAGAVDAADAGLTVSLLENGVVIGMAVSDDVTGAWSASVTLANTGVNAITAEATDYAGLTGASQPVDYVYGVDVQAFLADQSALDATPGGFTILDSAKNVAAAFATLYPDAHITAIELTDSGTPTLALTIGDALDGASTLAKITTPYSVVISDTPTDIEALTAAEAKALKADGYKTVTAQGPIILSVASANILAADDLTIIGATTTVVDKAAALKGLTIAQIDNLATLGVQELVASDSDVSFSVAQKAALGASGILLEQPFAQGSTQTLSFNGNGTLHELQDYGFASEPYVSLDLIYGASGKPMSETWSTSGGGVYKTETWNPDGSYAIDVNASGTAFGSPYTSYDVSYNALGKPVSETWSNGAAETWSYDPTSGALTEIVVTGITNAPYVETDTLYGASGKPTSETWKTSGGGVYKTETWNSDGSYAFHVNASGTAFGSPYTFYDVSYNALGKPVSETWSNGAAETWSYDPTGGALTEIVVTGITNAPYVETDAIYGASGKPTSETWDTSGGVYRTETWNSDGSYAIDVYASGTAFGSPYTSYDVSYNALGKPVSETWSNGAAETWSYDPTSGALTEIVVTGITNAPYVETDTLYGASGKPTSETWKTSGGGVYRTETWNSDGSYAIDVNASGTAFGSAYTSYNVNYNVLGKPVSETWSNGATKEWVYASDGSYETFTTPPEGAAFALETDIYDTTTAHAVKAVDLAESGQLTLLASGATVTQGASALSTMVAADLYTLAAHTTETMSVTGSADKLAFTSGFGNTTITGFSSSDALDLQLSMFNPAWFTPGQTQAQEAIALLSHATGSTNVVIKDAANDTLTLLGVTKSALSSQIAFT